MIATWCKYIVRVSAPGHPILRRLEAVDHSAMFEEFWLVEIPHETFVIGAPKDAWYTKRKGYRRKDIREVMAIVMGLPVPTATDLLCCVWTRHEHLLLSPSEMKTVDDLDVRREVGLLWNWIGCITRQTTSVQRTGGLFEEFEAWQKTISVTLPKPPTS